MRVFLSAKFHAEASNRDHLRRMEEQIIACGAKPCCLVNQMQRFIGKTPQYLMQETFTELNACDVLMVDLAEKGVGIGIEAGYAAALGKPIYVLVPVGGDCSETLRGIAKTVLFYADDVALHKAISTCLFQANS